MLILRVHEVLESIQEREKTLAKNEKVFARDTQVLQEVRQELIKQMVLEKATKTRFVGV